MSHIFISYKHGDFENSDFFQQLEDNTKSEAITIWRDTNIKAGENWEIAIDTAIQDCFAVLLLMTDNVSDSQYVNNEQSWKRLIARLSALKQAYLEEQHKQQTLSETKSRHIYAMLVDLYEARITQVTAEDILTELRSQDYISLLDYAHLIDLSRKNQSSGE